MQRLFLDAKVLISVLNKEYPLFPLSARILSLASHPRFKIYTSPLCLAIAFYFAEKKHGTALAKTKIEHLCKHIHIAANLSDGVTKTLANKKINDFEDGLEYYAAVTSKCDFIITEDIEDFYFSDISVLNCKSFFEEQLIKH